MLEVRAKGQRLGQLGRMAQKESAEFRERNRQLSTAQSSARVLILLIVLISKRSQSRFPLLLFIA